MKAWRGLFGRRRRDPVATDPPAADPFDAAGRLAPEPDALSVLLDRIEATALAVYAEHGLPTRRGHYRKGPRAAHWRWVAEHLSPEERFDRVLAQPPEKGWRHGVLEDLGAQEAARPRLIEASRLLKGTAALRRRLADGAMADDLAVALALGSRWRRLRDSHALRAGSRLKLKPPASAQAPVSTGAKTRPKPRP